MLFVFPHSILSYTMNIAVLLGGISPERNVSFASGQAIAHALQERGHTITLVDPARGADCVITSDDIRVTADTEVTMEELQSFSPWSIVECVQSGALDDIDIAFLGLHGRYGEDGYIQSLLDMRGVRYTGSGMTSSALAMDKVMTKRLMQARHIPTPDATIAAADAGDEAFAAIGEYFSGPVVVKPNDQGSTVGVTIVEVVDALEIERAVAEALRFSSLALIEQFIPGREFTVSVLGGQALPVVEIIPHEGFYDYRHKYTKGHTEYECPADLLEQDAEFMQNLAESAYEALGCRAYCRVDFRMDDEHSPFCLEVNTLPGMTSQSLFPKAAAAAGVEFGELCEKIIELS